MTESPGKFLKKERETRNISLEEISYFSKIKERHLKAIEEDRYDLLPPALYVKGYLNVYARYLNLNPKDIIVQYENYLKSLLPPEPIEPEKKVISPRKSIRLWFVLSSIFVAALVAILFIAQPLRHPAEKKTKTISLPLTSPSPPIQQAMKIRPIHMIERTELPGAEKAEVAPSTRGFSQSPGLSSNSKISQPAQAEAPARLQGVGIDPQQQFSAPPSARGIKDIETQQNRGFQVLEASIGRGIEIEGGRQSLIGKCTEFVSNNQRAYFFTRVKTFTAKKITHIWLWEGKEYCQMEIDVKPPAWSVYSYCTFRPQHAGNWKAEARAGDQVLSSLNFRVVQPTGDRSL
jgi:cytoskeleton protein RodZ